MTRDEMIEVMARAMAHLAWCAPDPRTTPMFRERREFDRLASLRSARDALSAFEAAGGAVVPAALLKEYRPTMAEDVMRHWAAELAASQQEKTDG